jgi:hypothetical protein
MRQQQRQVALSCCVVRHIHVAQPRASQPHIDVLQRLRLQQAQRRINVHAKVQWRRQQLRRQPRGAAPARRRRQGRQQAPARETWSVSRRMHAKKRFSQHLASSSAACAWNAVTLGGGGGAAWASPHARLHGCSASGMRCVRGVRCGVRSLCSGPAQRHAAGGGERRGDGARGGCTAVSRRCGLARPRGDGEGTDACVSAEQAHPVTA